MGFSQWRADRNERRSAERTRARRDADIQTLSNSVHLSCDIISAKLDELLTQLETGQSADELMKQIKEAFVSFDVDNNLYSDTTTGYAVAQHPGIIALKQKIRQAAELGCGLFVTFRPADAENGRPTQSAHVTIGLTGGPEARVTAGEARAYPAKTGEAAGIVFADEREHAEPISPRHHRAGSEYWAKAEVDPSIHPHGNDYEVA